MLVVTPVVMLWANDLLAFGRDKVSVSRKWTTTTAFISTAIFGFLAFSPLLQLPVNRSVLSILAVSPLLWAALRCSQRDTVVCTLILSAFAGWGGWPGNGPFGATPNEAFLISTIIVITLHIRLIAD